MPMLKNPREKYEPFIGPDLPNRTWPSKRITKAPRWLATDLRDGNQSLANPMTIDQKWAYFNLLVDLGYKEIEVSIPAASTIDFEFTRQLIETPGAVPDDVWLQVLCPCREDLIKRTVEGLTGANKAIVSLYYASSPTMLDTVFGMSQQDVYDRVVQGITYFRSITKDDPSQQRTRWNLMFSPEHFSGSDTFYCARLCEAAKAVWEPTTEDPIILTLPATVEQATPNVYADQVELFSSLISDREKVCVSLHVHNDRGCAVAAAELGQMAGAERVEGVLFGNGERAGNVDLITLALNLYSQGINPGVDFSKIASVRALVEDIIDIKVHPRTPYSGEMIFTAYSGAHQDAINKGLAKFKADSVNGHQALWKVPYLPMDPADLGLSHGDIIRLNSQSGKGGVAWTLEHQLHVQVPKDLQLQFSKSIKSASVASGGIISPPEVAKLFLERYFISEADPRILQARVEERGKSQLNGCEMDRSEIYGWNDGQKSAANGDLNGYLNGHSNGQHIDHPNESPNGHIGHVNGHVNGDHHGYYNDHSDGHYTGYANGHANGHSNGLPSRASNGTCNDPEMGALKTVDATIIIDGKKRNLRAQSSAVADALKDALLEASIGSFTFNVIQHDIRSVSNDYEAMLFVECQSSAQSRSTWGVRKARSGDCDTATLLAALSASLDLLQN